MHTTLELLEKATSIQPIPFWSKRLGLARQTLHNSRLRGHLSPAIAGALAEEMGAEPEKWIVIAALESERDSACKKRMLKRFVDSLSSAHFEVFAQHWQRLTFTLGRWVQYPRNGGTRNAQTVRNT
jgi:hypothetical protein